MTVFTRTVLLFILFKTINSRISAKLEMVKEEVCSRKPRVDAMVVLRLEQRLVLFTYEWYWMMDLVTFQPTGVGKNLQNFPQTKSIHGAFYLNEQLLLMTDENMTVYSLSLRDAHFAKQYSLNFNGHQLECIIGFCNTTGVSGANCYLAGVTTFDRRNLLCPFDSNFNLLDCEEREETGLPSLWTSVVADLDTCGPMCYSKIGNEDSIFYMNNSRFMQKTGSQIVVNQTLDRLFHCPQNEYAVVIVVITSAVVCSILIFAVVFILIVKSKKRNMALNQDL